MTDPLNSKGDFIEHVKSRHPNQTEYLQAVDEIIHDVWDLVANNSEYVEAGILEQLLEPDRVITFRVGWETDKGRLQVNRGYRVQTCNALGPYKGGLRFHPSVNESVLKFLAFEQTFKNSLTGLNIGSGKGGADFNPKKCSDREVMRFCRAFMTELHHHIGPETDVPAGDIGVGAREIGYLFGQYKALSRAFNGTLTGKELGFGGSQLRPEATGFGAVYFARLALEHFDEALEDRACLVSGAGNVARYCAKKLIGEGARVLTLSDSGGAIYHKDGLTAEHLDWLIDKNCRLPDLASQFDLDYQEDTQPWQYPGDLAFPCATQNEIDKKAAQTLAQNDCQWVIEGANMPCDAEALSLFNDANIHVCPGKAANAGGVAVSTLEMAQNATHRAWDREQVDSALQDIMQDIHARCVEQLSDDKADYVRAANRAGFIRVADAIVAQGY